MRCASAGTATSFNFDRFLQYIPARLGGINTIISGQLIQNYKKPVPSCVQLKRSLSEVMEYLATI